MLVAPACPLKRPWRREVFSRFVAGLVTALLLMGLPFRTTLEAQEERKPKVPGLDKITSGGPVQQAFMGIVKSVDLDNEVMDVDNVNGKSTEIFPLRKKVHVVTADGDKLKLAKLKPGTNVLVYYEQRGDHKIVTQIVVLTGGEAKKKAPPS